MRDKRFPNIAKRTEVRQNRSKWPTTTAETVASKVSAGNRSKPRQKMG